LRHGHEIALGPALRHDERDAPAGQPGEPFGEQIALRHLFGQKDLRRRHDVLAVELAKERGQDLPGAAAGRAIEEERLLADQSTLADEEELHARVGALAHDAYHVLIDLIGRDDLLAFAYLVE